MRYEKQILEAYKRIGFSPRDNQAEYIDQILIAFLDEKIQTVILSAPTGVGKSLIGVVVAEVVHSIKHPEQEEGSSFLLSSTNLLLQQYHDAFVDDGAPEDYQFHMLKGASNYECPALSTPEEPQNAESCAIQFFRKNHMDDMIRTYCDGCEYQEARRKKPLARHLITNYAYYFVDRMYAHSPNDSVAGSRMAQRTVCVFDEAHLLNDLFVDHNAIFFSEKRLLAFAEEVSEHLKLGNTEVFKNLKDIREHLVAGKINDGNYMRYLHLLHQTYEMITSAAKVEAERNSRNHAKFVKFSKLSKKYYNLGCKIDDLERFEYPNVFEYKPKDVKKGQNEHEVTVKAVFIGEMFEALVNAEHNLLMSATISESYVKRTMSLPGTTKYIRLPAQFPVENKKMIFFKTQTLNYNTMKDPAVVKRLCASAYQIVDHHTKLGERGLVLAPSFAVTQSIAETLRSMGGKYKVFEHVRGQKLAEVVEEFKSYGSSAAVLLTPSGFEGLDLPGDMSRFQIIVKMPFASLGDKRIKFILDTYPDVYGTIALQKVVQGAGRSVRSKEDYALTYVLDTAAQRAWTAKSNEWADEFQTLFTTRVGGDTIDHE